jgi:hypothetical protein
MTPTYSKSPALQSISRAALATRHLLGGEAGGSGGIMRVRPNAVGLSRYAADCKSLA